MAPSLSKKLSTADAKNVLGFEDFKNWDGVRFHLGGVPMAIIKLKEAIDVDDLLCFQYLGCGSSVFKEMLCLFFLFKSLFNCLNNRCMQVHPWVIEYFFIVK